MERKHSRNAAHVHGWDDYGRQVRAASAMWCDVNKSSNATTDRMQCAQVCHFVRVYVRRVIHVIVHNGLTVVEGVLVIVHTFT